MLSISLSLVPKIASITHSCLNLRYGGSNSLCALSLSKFSDASSWDVAKNANDEFEVPNK